MTTITIREARVSDAPQTHALMLRALAEPGIFLITTPEEFTYTVDDERKFIFEHLTTPNSCWFVAEAEPDGVSATTRQIVGVVSCRGYGREAVTHVTKLGITIAAGWRDRGIGGRLLARVATWARHNLLIKRVELSVMAPNTRAIHLYEKHGYLIEGVQRGVYHKYLFTYPWD